MSERPQNQSNDPFDPDQERPWPVYGQSGSSTQQPFQPPQPAQSPQSALPGSAPGPMPMPYYYTAGLPQKLPSRAGAITMLVVGIVMMIFIAPAATLFGSITGIDFQRITTGSALVANGGTVVLEKGEGIALVGTDPGNVDSCKLISSDSTTYPLRNNSGIFEGLDVPDGKYTLQCSPQQSVSFYRFSATDMSALFSRIMTALVWSTIIGFVGMGLTIAGSIWLAQRNRQRKEIMRRPPQQ